MNLLKRIYNLTCIIFFILYFPLLGLAQNTWTQKAYFNGSARQRMTGFSIGIKGYLGLGYDNFYKKDFWEYDPNTNVWTQKANFGGTARSSAVGFAIGNKGYIGTGFDGAFKNDFWEYDPVTNTWTQKAPLTGGPRTIAVGFSINNKGYIGTGAGGTLKNDFWEYNPNTNIWTAKANYGGGAISGATGFNIGNKGYIGTGQDAGANKKNDFWEYNPGNNTWLQKANFGGSARNFASSFKIGDKGYIGLGEDGMAKNDFWEYDTLSNIWYQRATFGGSSRIFAVGFSINNAGYFASGVDNDSLRSDLWVYAPPSSILTSPISGSPFCNGNIIPVSYTTATNYGNGNIFYAELSDATGSFANPVTIGSILSNTSGTIQSTIPINIPAGNAYRIRVSSTNPQNTGTNNGTNIIICSVTWPISFAPVCYNGTSFPLTGGTPSGGVYSGTGVDPSGNFSPSQVSSGTYSVTYTVTSSLSGCICTASNTITVLPPPTVSWPVSYMPKCGNDAPIQLSGALPSGGTYSGPGVDALGNFDPSQVPFGTTTFNYQYADAFGCTNFITNSINVINCIDCGECFNADTNQIINGNFENGNSGFTSFIAASCSCLVGSYCVTTDAKLKCVSFDQVYDHSSGSGKYLVIDGSTSSNIVVWQQNVNVIAGNSYKFSFWVHRQVSFVNANPVLNISINNVSLASINTALLPKHWYKIELSYSPVTSGNYPINIRQTNNIDPGCDYGIDDISFNSCTPKVIANAGPDRTICSSDTVHLDISNNLLTKSWYEINTGNPNNYPFLGNGNIVVSPIVSTCYLLIACNNLCCDTDTVCIAVNPLPIVYWPVLFLDVCTNQIPVLLNGGTPAGGIYSGSGVSGNYFDPAFAALGNNIVYYTYTNSLGCKNSVSKNIKLVHCVDCGPCFSPGPDLVSNGDFENGNTGFASNLFLSPICAYSSYDVVNIANQKCNLFNTVHDHTTGTGKFMVIDGNTFQPMDIWTNNVNVTTGNSYTFSFWMHPELSHSLPRADIDVIINNTVVLSIPGNNVPNQWTNFTVSWISNITNNIPITLHQTNFGYTGYDYGLDDIVFKECIPLVTVSWPIAFSPICAGQQPFLLTGGTPAGGEYSGPGVNNGYYDPAISPFGTNIITYTFTAPSGCSYSIKNTIIFNDTPEVDLPEPFSVCNTDGSFSIYTNPTGGIFSGNINPNGTFVPNSAPLGINLIIYTYTDPLTGCSNSDTTIITVVDCGCCDLSSGPGAEKIINGDFENGNTAFSIDPSITLDCNTCLFRSYCVISSAHLKCSTYQDIKDHTSGQGLYLVLEQLFHPWQNTNIIWEQNVSVVINQKYTFGFWLYENLFNIPAFSGPDLQVLINNHVIITLDLPLDGDGIDPVLWKNYCTKWVSDTTGIVSIKIIHAGNNGKWRDFGLDDISFRECKQNGCNALAGPDQNICAGQFATLSNLAGTSCDWYKIVNPGTNAFQGSGDIVVSPLASTCYILVCCTPTCCDTDTVCVNVNTPIVSWPVAFTPVCANAAPFALTGGLPVGGFYFGPGVDQFGNFNPSLVPFGNTTVTYTYVNNFGCSATYSHTINVVACISCGQCYSPSINLIVNGDFENGNIGFTSNLTFSCTCATGTYCVSNSPVNKCISFNAITDHTSGNGKFLIIDGHASQPNKEVWKQNIMVIAGQSYVYSFWINPALSNPTGRPNLNVLINNQTQASITTINLPGQWINYTYLWTATQTTTIPVSLVQTNIGLSGYDYGIDDITFTACLPTLFISAGQDDTICLNNSTTLNGFVSGPYLNIFWSPAIGLSCTNCLHPIASPIVTTNYTFTVTTDLGCIYTDTVSILVKDCLKLGHLKIFLQGFYKSNGTMVAVTEPLSNPTVCDTITIELHNALPPYLLEFSYRPILLTNGDCIFEYPPAATGNSYFIVVKHRNSLETWSASPVLFNSSLVNYDFSNMQNEAYGNNLTDFGDGNFGIYSGDINQNGTIDLTDFYTLKNSTVLFNTGYIREDLTGDWMIESSDFSLIENNLGKIILRP